MMATIVFAAVIAAAVALGWWLLGRRRPAPGPEQPFPGWDVYEGTIRYTSHAVEERMPERIITESDIRMILANPESVRPCAKSGEEGRTALEGIAPDGRAIRVIAAPSPDGEVLWIITAIALDAKITNIRVAPARRVRMLFDNLDRIKETGADVSVSKTDKGGNVVVTITSLIEPFRRDAVMAVEEIAKAK